jgi:hypothetical protein
VRDRLVDRLLFTVSMLAAIAVTTAVILAVVSAVRPVHGRLVVRPAATASPARPSQIPGG